MPGRRERRTEESLARLRERLQAEAERHRPDTTRIWARVEAAMAEQEAAPAPSPRRRRGGLWAVGAGVSTAAVLGVTSLVVVALTGRNDNSAVSLGQHGPGRPPTPGLSPPPADGRQTSDQDVAPGTPSPARHGPTRPVGGRGAGDALVSAVGALDRGSSPHWARDNLTLTVRRPLGALDVTIRIARDRWTFPAGSWSTFPGSALRSDTHLTHDAIVQRYRLQPGRTVAPGTYLIGVQYRPGGGHDPTGDVFTVVAAEAGGGPPVTLRGHF
jgi:hypothetical protein